MDQTGCTLLGCGEAVNSAFWNFSTLGGIVRLAVSAVFAVIIIIGIFMVIKAVITIIRSEGDETKIQEGYSIVKGVYIGIGIIFIGIIGLIIVIVFFGGQGVVNTTPTVPPGLNLPG